MSAYNAPATARAVGINPMAGTYTGAELTRAPVRGTRDTSEIPTRIGARLHYRDGRVTDLDGIPVEGAVVPPAPAEAGNPMPADTPAAMPAQAPDTVSQRIYKPRRGSAPFLVLATLRGEGAIPQSAYITNDEVLDLFHVKYSDWSAIFGTAIKGGALKKIKVHGKPALALPEYVGDPIKELKALITPDAQAKPTKATMPLTAPRPAAQPKPPELITGMAELAEAAERISHVLAATFEEINRIVREANTRIKTTTLKGAQS